MFCAPPGRNCRTPVIFCMRLPRPSLFRSAGCGPAAVATLEVAVPDHAVPTSKRELGTAGIADRVARRQVEALTANCRAFGIDLIEIENIRQCIVYVVGPE